MEEAGYQVRLARPDDVPQIRQIRFMMANPEGRAVRKRYEDAVQRGEVLVLAHFDPREHREEIEGFVEWHLKVDGSVTLRDAGAPGEEVHVGTVRRLVRELLHMLQPPVASVKLRADQAVWNSVFEQIPGFEIEGREYSRPYWRTIWEWTPAKERLAARPRAMPQRRRP